MGGVCRPHPSYIERGADQEKSMRGGKRQGAGRKTKWSFTKRLGLANSAAEELRTKRASSLKDAVRKIVLKELKREQVKPGPAHTSELKLRTDRYYDQIRVERRISRDVIDVLRNYSRDGILRLLPWHAHGE